MRFKYIRNSLMATCMSLALSQAYAMENPIDNSRIVVKKPPTDVTHSPQIWKRIKCENYTKNTEVKIQEYDSSINKATSKTKKFEEFFLKSIEFKPTKQDLTPTYLFLQGSLFVGEKQDQDGNKSFVILVSGQGINYYISQQAGIYFTNPEIKKEIDQEHDAYIEDLVARRLGNELRNKTEEEKENMRRRFLSQEYQLKENYRYDAIDKIQNKYEEGLSGGTDIERECQSSAPNGGTTKYSYRYPFKYSHQSQNPTDSVKFLAKFYQWGLIPDFFIDEIVHFIGIGDCIIPSNSIDEPAQVNNSHRENESTGMIITEQNASTPVQLELIPDEEVLQLQKTNTLPVQLEKDVPMANPSEMTIEQLYFPEIRQLLPDTNPDARRARTAVANIILGNGVAGNALQDFSLSEKTLLDLLRVGIEKEQRIQELEAQLTRSSTPPILTPSQEEKELALIQTSAPQSVTKGPQGTTVVTDDNGNASYQLESNPFNVTGGQTIEVHYDITVEADGVMSLGLLNTGRNGWYGDELILRVGSHAGTFERIVPSDETKTSLVFRNYRGILDQSPGQTTFTIKKVSLDY